MDAEGKEGFTGLTLAPAWSVFCRCDHGNHTQCTFLLFRIGFGGPFSFSCSLLPAGVCRAFSGAIFSSKKHHYLFQSVMRFLISALAALTCAVLLGSTVFFEAPSVAVPFAGVYPDAPGGYDMHATTAPVLGGWPLIGFAYLLRLPIVGNIILSKLMNDNRFFDMIRFAQTVPHPDPLFYPIAPATPDELAIHADSTFAAERHAAAAKPAGGLHAQAHLTNSRILDLHTAYKEGVVSPVDVIRAVMDSVMASNLNDGMKSFVRYREGEALAEARKSAERYAKKQPASLMDGVPIGIKIELAVAGQPYTLGSESRAHILASVDSTPVQKLKRAGAIIVGLTNMEEIGIGITGFNQWYGTALNPYNRSYHTGGSSSGSAAAVASGLVPVAIGADGGGSIRIPAGFCGVIGLKPTFGRVDGESELAWTIGHVGPFTTTVDDSRIVLGILADARAMDSKRQPSLAYRSYPIGDLSGLRVGVCDEFNGHADQAMRSATSKAIQLLVARGAVVVPIVFPHLSAAFQSHVAAILSEMGYSTSAYELTRFGYTAEINLRLARRMTATHYVASAINRRYFFNLYRKLFGEVDVVITPNTAVAAPKITEHVTTGETNLTLTAEVMRFNFLGNLIGFPAVTVPVGITDDGTSRPVAVQLAGTHWSEPRLLRVAKILAADVGPMPIPIMHYGPAYMRPLADAAAKAAASAAKKED